MRDPLYGGSFFEKGSEMKVTYLGHSGFAVELEHMILLFDYYTGRLPQWPKEKLLLVFASHSHPDHFNPKVLKLADEYPRLHYFFGNDIRLGEKWLVSRGIDPAVKKKVTKLAGGRTEAYGEGQECVRVDTLRSTDAGVAFLVEAEGKRIYHAGDLNWWHWPGEPEADNEAMGTAYRKEIDSIAGQHFDLAFVPLDPRQEECFFWGMEYFLKNTDSPVVFPMHMWGKYETAGKFKQLPQAADFSERVMDVGKGGQQWNI